MELLTKIKNKIFGVSYEYDSHELQKQTKILVNDLKKFIKEKDYQFKTDNSEYALNGYYHMKWAWIFDRSSKRTVKRFQKYIDKFKKKKSLHSLNLLFHFMHTRLLATKQERNNVRWTWDSKWEHWVEPYDVSKVVLIPPEKELLIQEKRKKWKEAQAISEQLLLEYKEEKGDYYKS